MRESLRTIEQELRRPPERPSKPRIRRTTIKEVLPTIDITYISATDFYFNLYRSENEVFQTSLYEIDRILEKRAELDGPQTRFSLETAEIDKQRLVRLLPKKYASYADVFSKAASNTLSPHRTYDYRI